MNQRKRPHTPTSIRDHRHGDRPLPLDPESLNTDRALWAAIALEAFRRETGADLTDAVSDLLADLMHWCDRFGHKFQHEMQRALNHYAEETCPRAEPPARVQGSR